MHLRKLLPLASLLALGLGGATWRASYIGQSALDASTLAWALGDERTAIEQARYAATSWVPFAAYPGQARAQLLRLATHAETRGDLALARYGLESVLTSDTATDSALAGMDSEPSLGAIGAESGRDEASNAARQRLAILVQKKSESNLSDPLAGSKERQETARFAAAKTSREPAYLGMTAALLLLGASYILAVRPGARALPMAARKTSGRLRTLALAAAIGAAGLYAWVLTAAGLS
jgi:hypothetical protein